MAERDALRGKDAGVVSDPDPVTVEQVIRARRQVVRLARDDADATLIQTILGIGPEWPTGWRGTVR